MKQKQPITEENVDALVRAYLESEGTRVDVTRLESAISARLPKEGQVWVASTNRGLKVQTWLGPAKRSAIAACLCIAVGSAFYFALSPQPAGAYALVSAAQEVLATGRDRCYRIEGRVPGGWLKANPLLNVRDETLVWTRGDRFRVTTTDGQRQIAWGQDEERNFWLTNDNVGYFFEPGKTPKFLSRTKAYLSLNVRQIIRHFLDDFDLTFEKMRDDGQPIVRVQATLKSGHAGAPFDSAWLEIEKKTKLIRRLEIERGNASERQRGLTFTLIEQAALSDDTYRVYASLPANAEVLGPRQAAERDRRFWELIATLRPQPRNNKTATPD